MSPYGNSQNGKQLNNNSETLLNLSLKVLEKTYKKAKKKDDTETMLAVSDRLMILYGMLEEVKANSRGKSLGFVDVEGSIERG